MKLVKKNERAWLDANANSSDTPQIQGTIVTANKVVTLSSLTDNSGGAAADGTIAVVTAPNLASWDGATIYPSAAQATAIIAAITALTNAVKELSTKQNALITSLTTAGVML